MKKVLLLAALLTCFSAHAAAFENPRQGEGYLHSSWSTVHADSSNSDHVPLAMTAKLQQRWHILEGAGIWTPPVVAEDGTVYAVTGEGAGHSHLHAISPDGKIVWQSAPQRSPADLDSLAVISAPVLDESGDVYLGDSNDSRCPRMRHRSSLTSPPESARAGLTTVRSSNWPRSWTRSSLA